MLARRPLSDQILIVAANFDRDGSVCERGDEAGGVVRQIEEEREKHLWGEDKLAGWLAGWR